MLEGMPGGCWDAGGDSGMLRKQLYGAGCWRKLCTHGTQRGQGVGSTMPVRDGACGKLCVHGFVGSGANRWMRLVYSRGLALKKWIL